MTIQPPDPSSRVVDSQARIDPIWDRFLRNLWRLTTTNDTSISTINETSASVEQFWSWSTMIETPSNTTYTWPSILPANATIEQIYVVTQSGSCTVTVQISNNDLSALSATTTKSSLSFSEVTEENGDLIIAITNNSSAVNLGIGIVGTIVYTATGDE